MIRGKMPIHRQTLTSLQYYHQFIHLKASPFIFCPNNGKTLTGINKMFEIDNTMLTWFKIGIWLFPLNIN